MDTHLWDRHWSRLDERDATNNLTLKEESYNTIGAIAAFIYFAWFIVIVPVVGIIENTLMDIATDKQS